MIFKEGELKLLFPFYLYYIFIGISGMAWPYIMIYFRDIGLSFSQISVLFASFSIGMFFFEIPTGAFADGFSRKYSVILGFFISGFAILGISFVTSFWALFALFLLMGFGLTFVSGAEEAWVIDNLNHYKRQDLHSEFFIKSHSIVGIIGAISPLVGAYVVTTYSMLPLWWVWSACLFIGGIILLIWGKEKYVPKKVNVSKMFIQTFKKSVAGLKYARHHKNTFYLVLATIFFALLMIDADFWPPLLQDFGMPLYGIGILSSILFLISGILPFSARYLQKYSIKNVFTLLISVRILVLLTVWIVLPGQFLLAAWIYLISEILMGMHNPLIGPYFQKQIPKRVRATVTSIKSMALQLGLGVGILVFGALSDVFSLQTIIPLTGVFGIAAIYCFQKLK